MNKTKRKRIVKRVLQGTAAAFCLLAVAWIYCGVLLLAEAPRESSLISFLFPLLFFLLAAAVLTVTAKVLWRFNYQSVKNLLGLTAFGFFVAVSKLFPPGEIAGSQDNLFLLYSAAILLPVVLAFAFYRLLTHWCFRWLELEPDPGGKK